MSVVRIDVNQCVGCKNCVEICPMDVFYFNEQAKKSVLAYPENCQSCGQCVLNCKGHCLGVSNEMYGYPINAFRGLSTAPMNHIVVSDTGELEKFTKGRLGGK